MSDSEDEGVLSLGDVFTEPPRPASPEPTYATYHRDTSRIGLSETNWKAIDIQLVGSHPLWAHHLWNASRSIATYLDEHPELYKGRSVLELGAGGGLPGIVAGKNGASSVVLTDYPDEPLLENLRCNVSKNFAPDLAKSVFIQGYIWGHPVKDLLSMSRRDSASGFDVLILSDLIFNHSQHDSLLKTCDEALAREDTEDKSRPVPCVLVFYTHHRPHLAHRDMEFFEKAKARGWTCEEVVTEKFPPMFPEDPGEEEIRATVHGQKLIRAF
ncbi:hypothetical protein NLI96_g9346 [Meripilus lineatus]|uniref:Protein N-terminal and lysine N-methyltransferase EFM7 n=1 Tax=Meripilus lineatus TaxID=2056292 RepID=A0AAD5UVS9_9APHY|nr:hypothetical protein NLI96_g9346 [Physisporinus lineatus]